jgi:hypothetical protein
MDGDNVLVKFCVEILTRSTAFGLGFGSKRRYAKGLLEALRSVHSVHFVSWVLSMDQNRGGDRCRKDELIFCDAKFATVRI